MHTKPVCPLPRAGVSCTTRDSSPAFQRLSQIIKRTKQAPHPPPAPRVCKLTMSLSPFAGGMPSDPGRSPLDVGWSIITPPPNVGWGVVQPRTSSAVRAWRAYGANTRWRRLAMYFRRRPEVPVKGRSAKPAGRGFSVCQTANCNRVAVYPSPISQTLASHWQPQIQLHILPPT